MSEQRIRVQTHPVGESRTEQSHIGETNINAIIGRYHRTGLLPQRGRSGFYGDFTGITDYHDAVNRVKSAEDAFMSLPSKIRKRFENDPYNLLTFLENDDNRQEAIELGILPSPQEEASLPPEPEPVPAPAE